MVVALGELDLPGEPALHRAPLAEVQRCPGARVLAEHVLEEIAGLDREREPGVGELERRRVRRLPRSRTVRCARSARPAARAPRPRQARAPPRRRPRDPRRGSRARAGGCRHARLRRWIAIDGSGRSRLAAQARANERGTGRAVAQVEHPRLVHEGTHLEIDTAAVAARSRRARRTPPTEPSRSPIECRSRPRRSRMASSSASRSGAGEARHQRAARASSIPPPRGRRSAAPRSRPLAANT